MLARARALAALGAAGALRRASATAARSSRARRPTSSSTTSRSWRRLPTEVAHDVPGGEWRRIQRARGYRYILVNGEVTIEDDRETGAHAGRLLRHGAAPGRTPSA